MAKTNVNIRMDSDLKKQFENFCSDMGMTMTTAFNVFAKKAVREYRIPFDVGAEIPNKETLEAFEEIEAMKKNKNLGKAYTNTEDLIKDILG